MAIKPFAVSDATFQQEVITGSSEKPVLVDFWAEWCGPCRTIAPILEQIATEKSDRLKVAKLDVDDSPNSAHSYGVMSIPTLILFKDGKPVKQIVGSRPKENILSQIEMFL